MSDMLTLLFCAFFLVSVLVLGVGIWVYDNIFPKMKSGADRLLKGNLNFLGETYLTYFVHMRDRPEEWLFNSDKARFPKEGGVLKIFILS